MAHEKSEEQILREMQETRASLTEKLETLEQKVVGTVENATSAVNETVGAIKETVHDTVATVNQSVHDTVASVNQSVKGGVDTVKDMLDVPAHVDNHPWLMLGGSVAVGYVLGTMLTPPAQQPMHTMHTPQPTRPFAPSSVSHQTNAPAPAPSTPPQESMFGPELNKLKGLALGVLFGTARELLRSYVPEHLGDKIEQVVDAVTKKAGGEPLPSEDFQKWTQPASEESREQESSMQSNEYGNGHKGPRRW